MGILRRRSTSESYTCLRFSINHNISRINRAQIAACLAICLKLDASRYNRFGWSFFFVVWRRCARSQLHMNSVVLVESQGSCALVRIVRLQKIWQEGQHDLHSPPQPIDWREHTIGAVHDRNLPTRSLQVPESYENFLWHRVKVRSIVTGLHHDDERDDDRSHRRVSIMSSLDAGWFRLITNILYSVAWPCHDCEVAPVWHHDVTNGLTCQFFRRLFDRLPVRI